jgi:hypothetical protein
MDQWKLEPSMASETRYVLRFRSGEFYHGGTEAQRHGGVIVLELQDETLDSLFQNGGRGGKVGMFESEMGTSNVQLRTSNGE